MTKYILVCLFTVSALGSSVTPLLAADQANPSLEELRHSADAGDLSAQLQLADRYYRGDNAPQDFTQAAHWYRHLAERDFAKAQLTLGLMYIRGEGVDQDNAAAVHWLSKAAEQKTAAAQYLLGLAYQHGHGVPVDLTQAYMWLEISSALDYPHTQQALEALAGQLSAEDIATAEQMATDWWMQHHH